MAERKNIILISIDDGIAFWRYRHVFGPALLTPNLDRMAEAATAFTSAYCQVPICGPSRASMLTGLSPFETGIVDNYTAALRRCPARPSLAVPAATERVSLLDGGQGPSCLRAAAARIA